VIKILEIHLVNAKRPLRTPEDHFVPLAGHMQCKSYKLQSTNTQVL